MQNPKHNVLRGPKYEKYQHYILMYLLLLRDVWLDNVKNLWQYTLLYTVGNSLSSLIMSLWLDDVWLYTPRNTIIWEETVEAH